MLDGPRSEPRREHKPDLIVPEIEAIDTATLAQLEGEGWRVGPVGKGVAADHEPRRHSATSPRASWPDHLEYRFAENREDAIAPPAEVGLPCVVKPVMSSSGKGRLSPRQPGCRSCVDYAVEKMPRPAAGDREEFYRVRSEITLLTVANQGRRAVCRRRPPPGRGDYRESWQPAAISRAR